MVELFLLLTIRLFDGTWQEYYLLYIIFIYLFYFIIFYIAIQNMKRFGQFTTASGDQARSRNPITDVL